TLASPLARWHGLRERSSQPILQRLPTTSSMPTSRGWWFVAVTAAMLALGGLAPTGSSREALTLLGATPAPWVAYEWLMFQFRARVLLRRLQVVREVCDERGPVESLWCGRTFHVRVTLRLPKVALGFPFLSVREFAPFGARISEGETTYEGPLPAG